MDHSQRAPYSTREPASAPRPNQPSGTREGGDSRPSPLQGPPPGPEDSRTPPKPTRAAPSALQKLKNKVGVLEESLLLQRQAHSQAQHEVHHYKDRVLRDGESHKLDIQVGGRDAGRRRHASIYEKVVGVGGTCCTMTTYVVMG